MDSKKKVRRAWGEKISYLCFDMTKNKEEGKYRIFSETKNLYIACIPESGGF